MEAEVEKAASMEKREIVEKKMNRLHPSRTRSGARRSGRLMATWAAFALFAMLAPVGAWAASFTSTGIGFDPTTLPPPDFVIDGDDEWLSAGDPSIPNLDVVVSGSANVCILIGSSTTCDAGVDQGVQGPISFLVSLTVTSVDTPFISGDGPFTLLLSDLNPAQGYGRSDVTIDLAPDAIPGLDTSATPGFIWDPNSGVNGFSPFNVIQDDFKAASGTIQYYIGWTVSVGDTVTYKLDLADGVAIRADVPALRANAVGAIPEPGTALLIGIGLAGLGMSRRRV